MKLRFLGKGAAFFPAYGNTGAFFFKGDDLFLLDCGESMFAILHEKGILERAAQVYVLVTHLHADHVGSLGSLISYFYCVRKRPVTVIHPERTVVELLDLEGIDRNGYCYCQTLPEEVEGLRAEAVEVRHVDNMVCYGYLMDDGSGISYYSGDAADIPEQIVAGLLEGSVAWIYQDTSSHESEKPTHCYFGKLERMIPPEWRNRVYCMHLDGPYEELLKSRGFQVVEVDAEIGR